MIDESVVTSNFVTFLKSHCINALKKVILFGSRAKGTARPDSDFDLLIVLEKRDSNMIDRIYDEVVEFFLKYEVDISLKIYKKDDYERFMAIPTPFFNEIKRTGKILYG
ncbi:MAG: nucleotidyltransferase domain-containing protein [Nitrospinae bacterium]|nr:nucleotidyltransferase domain-containing protein [Nitrospinota bacterium]